MHAFVECKGVCEERPLFDKNLEIFHFRESATKTHNNKTMNDCSVESRLLYMTYRLTRYQFLLLSKTVRSAVSPNNW